MTIEEVLALYPMWKQLSDGIYVAVVDSFSFGKCRVLVGVNLSGYENAY